MKWTINLSIKFITENKARTLFTFISILSATLIITNILILGATMRARTSTSTDVIYGSLAFFLGLFLVSNNLMMKLDDRMRALGILKALGMSKKQMFYFVITETLIIGIVAIIFGTILGVFSAMAIYFFSKRGLEITPFVLAPRDLIISFFSCLLMVLLAAVFPAMKAGKTVVIDSIYSRKASEGFLRKYSVKIGAFVMVLSLIMVFLFGILDRDLAIIRAFGAISIFGFFIGVSLFSPQLIKFFLLLGSSVIRRSVNHLGQLASESLIINRKRAVLTTLSIIITVAIFFYQSIENINVSESFAQLSRNANLGDASFTIETKTFNEGELFYNEIHGLSRKDKEYWLKPDKETKLSLAEFILSNQYTPESLNLIRSEISKLPNETIEIGQTQNYYLYNNEQAYLWPVTIFYVDPVKYNYFDSFKTIDILGKEAIHMLKRGNILVTLNTASNLKIKKDDVIEIAAFDVKHQLLEPIASMNGQKAMKSNAESGLSLAKKNSLSKKLKVGGIIKNNMAQMAASVFMDKKTAERLLGRPPLAKFGLKVTKGENPSKLKEKIQRLVDDSPKKRAFIPTKLIKNIPMQIPVTAPESDITSDKQQADIWRTDPQGIILGLSFLIMIIAISTGNISSTMANSIVERKNELTIMRAIGVAPRQIRAVVLLEGLILSLLGWLVGITAAMVIGITSSVSSALSMNQLGVSFSVQLPIKQLILSILVVIMIGVASGIYPAKQAVILSKSGKLNNE